MSQHHTDSVCSAHEFDYSFLDQSALEATAGPPRHCLDKADQCGHMSAQQLGQGTMGGGGGGEGGGNSCKSVITDWYALENHLLS